MRNRVNWSEGKIEKNDKKDEKIAIKSDKNMPIKWVPKCQRCDIDYVYVFKSVQKWYT